MQPPDAAADGRAHAHEPEGRRTPLLGRGEHVRARRADRARRAGPRSSEPQFVGPVAVLTAELRRREGDLGKARRRRPRAGPMEFCTDDAARVSAGGRRRRDRGGRRRPARPRPRRRRRRGGVTAVDDLLSRWPPRRRTRPIECALLLTRAEAGRAGGRPDPSAFAPRRGGADAPPRIPAAACVWREAEAHIAAGDREAGSRRRRARPRPPSTAGARGLRGELRVPPRRLSAVDQPRGRAESAEARGFAQSTPRERQVLALVAEGATNREIGAELFMAEKTASVHVSRIPSKLNARGRRQRPLHRHRLS